MIALVRALFAMLAGKLNPIARVKRLGLCLTTLFACVGCSNPPPPVLPLLSNEESIWVGEQIFRNECNLKIECLTSWNSGESFPSLGIGHFIWFQAEQKEAFVESFPALLAFYSAQGQALPAWIEALPTLDSPWGSRAEFLLDLDSPRMSQLRQFLLTTQATQVQFIVDRMRRSLPLIASNAANPDAIVKLFTELTASHKPIGMYALIDYVNFKGEGTAPQERYNGQGWGLLQVLEHLSENRQTGDLLPQFADSARYVLARRVANAPAERNEEQWLTGWNNRLNTYSIANAPSPLR